VSAENRKSRLRRLDRVFVDSPIYFITACTYERRTILANARVHEAFLDFASVGPQHGAWIGAYVIMPDHLHLFISLDDRRIVLTAWMKSLKNAVSKALRLDGIPPPHWQKRF
jgi:putative transposase